MFATRRLAISSARLHAQRTLSKRSMSSDTLKKKDSAAEQDYINRHDREALKTLLQKLSKQQPNDALEKIFHDHSTNLSPALKEALNKWKSEK